MCNTSEKEYLQETTIDLNGEWKKRQLKKQRKKQSTNFCFLFSNTFGNSVLN